MRQLRNDALVIVSALLLAESTIPLLGSGVSSRFLHGSANVQAQATY